MTIEGSRGGVYSVIGEKNSLPELLRSDEQFRMYFTAPAPALQTNSQRGLSLAGKGDGNEGNHAKCVEAFLEGIEAVHSKMARMHHVGMDADQCVMPGFSRKWIGRVVF